MLLSAQSGGKWLTLSLTAVKDSGPITLCQRQRFTYSWQVLSLGEERRRVAQGFYSDMEREAYKLPESFEASYCRETPARMTLTRGGSRDMGLVLLLFA